MAIYVDELRAYELANPEEFCHLIADRGAELREVAEAMQLSPDRLYDKNFPHYRLNEAERQRAIFLGAVELARQTYVEAVMDIEKMVKEKRYGTYRP